ALVAATTGLAAGNLAIRTGLGDEPGALGQLARDFDEMAETLQRRQAEMDRANAELRRSEARKSAILEGALDCVIGMDQAGLVVEFNPAAEITLGYTRAEARGRPVDELIIPPRLRDDPATALGSAVARGKAEALRQRGERVAMRKDGSEFPVEVSVTATEGEGAALFTAFLRDITERKQAEAALRAAHDELQKRVEARTAELKEANERLVDWVEELQQRAQDMRLLNEAGDHLQAGQSVQEADDVRAQYGRSLFPDEPGALFMLNEAHNLVECVAAWGSPPPAEEIFTPDDCRALRRGRPHLVEGPDAHLVCRHVGLPTPAAYVCVPLMAQSTALGVLHLVEHPSERPLRELAPHHVLARRQLAFTVADQVALALTNLRLQERLRDQAIRDPLTGLFNRRYMEESLERELRRAQRREEAGRLRVEYGHQPLGNITISVGVAVFPDHGVTVETLLKSADAALYRAKAGGRDRVMVATT